MSQQVQKITKNKMKWELLRDAIKLLNYGEVITHDQISLTIQEPYGTNLYRSTIARAKKDLLKAGKYITSVQGRGYRVLLPNEYSKKAVDQFETGFRAFKKGKDVHDFAPVNDMEQKDRMIHRNIGDRINLLHANLKGDKVTLNMLVSRDKNVIEIEGEDSGEERDVDERKGA